MEDVTLLLYLKDVEYGKRLLRFLVQKKNPGLHPELVTARSKMEFRVGTETRELVVLTDDPGIYGDGKRKVISLSNIQDRSQRKIFQFQKAEDIYQELLWQLKMEPEKKHLSEEKEVMAEEGVYAVFSPDAAGATELSVLLAQYMAKQGRCLYLQMSGFPVYSGSRLTENLPDMSGGIGELLFLLEQENFVQQTEGLCQQFGKAEMLPPLAHYKDLLDCRPEDWECLVSRLKKECGYVSIVVEVGSVYEFFLEILDQADHVLFLQSPGVIGMIQRKVFQRYCQTEHKEGLLSKTRYIRQPEDFAPMGQEWINVDLDELSEDRQKMECIKSVLGGDAGDGYIMEDIG